MKVLCIYPSRFEMELPLGLLYIATALKKRGHLVKLFSLNRSGYLFRFTNFSKYLLLREINLYNPDMVCFTIHSNEYDFIIEISKMIKIHSHAKIVVGGPHVTFMADEIDYNVIDYACRGEGDEAIIELAECIKNNESPERIKNIYCIYNGKLLQNSLRDLITDLDSLPFPDRSLINQVHLRRHGTNVITGRGCPYTCTYCIAKPLSDFYRHLGKYVRWRTKENVIEELLWLKSHYSISRIAFSDQTFTLNKRRLLEFLELYNSKIKLPFICQTRVDCVDKEVFSALKKAGCEIVFMGIESGDKDIRLKTLRRNQTDEQIIDAFKLAKGVGINTIAFNMVGIPGETINTINKSIDFYRIVKPDNISTNIFMPFPGTYLYEWCEEKEYIKNLPQGSYRFEGSLELPSLPKNWLLTLSTTFEFGVKAGNKLYRFKPTIDWFVYILFKTLGGSRKLNIILNILVRNLLRIIWKLSKVI